MGHFASSTSHPRAIAPPPLQPVAPPGPAAGGQPQAAVGGDEAMVECERMAHAMQIDEHADARQQARRDHHPRLVHPLLPAWQASAHVRFEPGLRSFSHLIPSETDWSGSSTSASTSASASTSTSPTSASAQSDSSAGVHHSDAFTMPPRALLATTFAADTSRPSACSQPDLADVDAAGDVGPLTSPLRYARPAKARRLSLRAAGDAPTFSASAPHSTCSVDSNAEFDRPSFDPRGVRVDFDMLALRGDSSQFDRLNIRLPMEDAAGATPVMVASSSFSSAPSSSSASASPFESAFSSAGVTGGHSRGSSRGSPVFVLQERAQQTHPSQPMWSNHHELLAAPCASVTEVDETSPPQGMSRATSSLATRNPLFLTNADIRRPLPLFSPNFIPAACASAPGSPRFPCDAPQAMRLKHRTIRPASTGSFRFNLVASAGAHGRTIGGETLSPTTQARWMDDIERSDSPLPSLCAGTRCKRRRQSDVGDELLTRAHGGSGATSAPGSAHPQWLTPSALDSPPTSPHTDEDPTPIVSRVYRKYYSSFSGSSSTTTPMPSPHQADAATLFAMHMLQQQVNFWQQQ